MIAIALGSCGRTATPIHRLDEAISMNGWEQGIADTMAEIVTIDREVSAPETDLADLGLDSKEIMGLVFELETKFGNKVPDDADLASLKNVRSIARTVMPLLAR